MNTIYILALLYMALGLFIGIGATSYANDKYRAWYYWPKFWLIMLLAWPVFIWSLTDN